MAPAVAKLLAAELGRNEEWECAQVSAYRELAAGYLIEGAALAAGEAA
jgi:glycerol-3-phosphate dehydrogenase